MRHFCLILLMAGGPAFADDWRQLSGDEIREALTDQTVDYEAAWQRFNASSKTPYNAGQDSWGNWDVRGDAYCSEWPPQSAWVCYDVDLDADGQMVRFRGAGNDVTEGRFRE